jgi:hypothetical protein
VRGQSGAARMMTSKSHWTQAGPVPQRHSWLIGEVAQGYFQLLGLELQLQIAKETADSFGQT